MDLLNMTLFDMCVSNRKKHLGCLNSNAGYNIKSNVVQ